MAAAHVREDITSKGWTSTATTVLDGREVWQVVSQDGSVRTVLAVGAHEALDVHTSRAWVAQTAEQSEHPLVLAISDGDAVVYLTVAVDANAFSAAREQVAKR